MTNIFLTSDLHFGHANSIPFTNRPWNSVEEMDEALIDNWNSVVSPKDSVYVIGDFSFHRKGMNNETNLNIFNRLQGNKHLVIGNHDPKLVQQLPWCWVKDNYGLKYKEEYIWLSHYPHMSWNRSYHGSLMAHGHVHSKGGDYWQCQNTCDVGVDYWRYRPVNATEFIEHLTRIREFALALGMTTPFFWRGNGTNPEGYQFFGFPKTYE